MEDSQPTVDGRRRPARRWVALVAVVFLLLAVFAYDPEPSFRPRPSDVTVSDEARRIHEEAIVVDLHVDSLLWPRELTVADLGGQVDFPRMREGGLDAAAFTIPTAFFGVAGLKAFHDHWPVATWFSPGERLRYQLEKMKRWTDADEVELATNASAIRRAHDASALAVFHGIEGAHALEGDVRRVREVSELGVVFIAPVHLSDNAFGGSSSGTAERGLTELGRDLVREMNQERVLLDLAHASLATFDEAIALTTLPPLVSHTGVRAVHDSRRNLSDEQIRAVAERGGVIGIMLAPPALSESSLVEALDHIAHVIDIASEDAAAIGSDFDGYVSTPIDAAGLPELTELMLRRGFSEERIRKILGENVLRILP